MNSLRRSALAVIAGASLLTACASLPSGPSVMVLPGRTKDFSAFQADDYTCRSWAAQQTGVNANQATANSAVTSAAVGTAVGAAAGAALGAAAGVPATGAAIGAGSGLLVGAAAGTGASAYSGAQAQERYDSAYLQCMYAKGNQVPVAGEVPPPRAAGPPPGYGPPIARRDGIPPPPYGPPPPPPPGAN